MTNFNSQGEAIPEHLWRLGLAVRTLIEKYDAMDKWRRHVRGWVMHVREAAGDPGSVVYLPQTLKIDEEYALLAAIHDTCASPKRNEELIHPWAAEEDFTEPDKLTPEVLNAIATYIFLMKHVLPEQGRRGIERSKADRLVEILRHVANDLRNAARLWTPDRSIYAGESEPDIVDEYESFLRRTDTETGNSGTTTQVKKDETPGDDGKAPAVEPPDPAGGSVEKGTTWQDAQAYMEQCRQRGERFTSQDDFAKRLDCSSSTVNKAIHNGTAELEQWASKHCGPSRLNVSPKAAAVALKKTPQGREPDPGNAIEQPDVDVAMQFLIEQAKRRSPELGADAEAKIRAMDEASRRAMAERLYDNPDQAEQVERYRKRARERQG